ncbi:hypothetical protein ACFY5D_00910 [Paeniglutamicibacter sp. NPDC012692]
MTVRYLAMVGITTRLGISPNTIKKYADDGPKSVLGWLSETIGTWNANRP